jgi:hypothetical protein
VTSAGIYSASPVSRDLFRVACNMKLEGIVSKRRDGAYVLGKCRHRVKTKNPAHPAYRRVGPALIYSVPKISRQALSEKWQCSRSARTIGQKLRI